jgi:hypothetical protein
MEVVKVIETERLLEKLKETSLEEIQEKMGRAEERDEFEILLICRELKKLLEQKPPRTYTEWVEFSFLFQLFLSALKTWLEAYNWEHQEEVKL